MNDVIERGAVVMFEGKFWGIVRSDGQSREYGWVDITEAKIRDPEFAIRLESFTYTNSPYLDELRKGKVVMLKRITTFELE